MSFYKKLATIFLAGISSISVAKTKPNSIFPRGCETNGFVFYRDFLVVNEHGKQTFYLIQNHSNQTIEMEHFETKADTFMSPKLEAKLAPTHWSAFASDVEQLYLRCYLQAKDNSKENRVVVNCGDFLSVCQYPRVKFALSNQGSYWVSTDKTQYQVIQDATAKGIFLHW